ncbi:monodehydroascorbate reductase 4, peroxisomal-like [Olea europaea var. sylvestris]|uniref:monodehydroascorbate reductase 4, peroxisomal-like n=1 Tax=Olea europaea var. sylvestris TaxID=158386 RepID=UPI000C1D1AEF|nr:monodehydroascorbate reductase 4, peroxisomal-like [Olea europaea var. sylvestris]
MGRAFDYVIVGGGVAAGYAAHEFVKRGVSHGELCIISEESVAPYERPALSKGYLLPKDPVRLPSFHCCVGTNEENLTPNWYKEHGIELILNTQVKSADVKSKTLLTSTGETISYKILIVATGARPLKLEETGVSGSDAANVCYLRDLADAERLVNVMQSSSGGNAIVIGGGYIGMECAASLVINKLKVTMVFPGAHCMATLFTPKIASYYEETEGGENIVFDSIARLKNLRNFIQDIIEKCGIKLIEIPTKLNPTDAGTKVIRANEVSKWNHLWAFGLVV